MKLTLYSPLQVDVIDRDSHGQAIPLEAVGSDRAEEYLDRIMSAFRALQPQEDARSAFTSPDEDWSEVSDKIVSLTRRWAAGPMALTPAGAEVSSTGRSWSR